MGRYNFIPGFIRGSYLPDSLIHQSVIQFDILPNLSQAMLMDWVGGANMKKLKYK